jgi:hypothetical protein
MSYGTLLHSPTPIDRKIHDTLKYSLVCYAFGHNGELILRISQLEVWYGNLMGFCPCKISETDRQKNDRVNVSKVGKLVGIGGVNCRSEHKIL